MLALIGAQQQVIATLEARIRQLEQRLGSSGGTGVPGTKPAQRSKASGRPRKQRDHGYSRMRMVPTTTVTHAADRCLDCGTRLQGGWVTRRREVIDLPIAPITVTEHQIVVRTCPVCRRRVRPPAPLAGVVAGRQRLGVRLVSLIVTLREAVRVPVRRIQWLLEQLYDLHLSRGAITAASDRVAACGAAELGAIRDRIRGSPLVHADETGWRENGQNGYAWTFCTPTDRYFVRRSRSKAVVDEVLGETFAGVLCCDFYAAYHQYPGLKQRCWVHLLREIHDLTVAYPDAAGLADWAQQVRTLFAAATTFTSPDARTRVAAQQHFEQRLLALCTPFTTDPTAIQAKLCRRIQRHSSELFVFVAHPEVPADNNAAERSVRPLVTSRKISGGTRSPQGSTTKMTLASLFGTW
ncbi:MAG TPA: IS66 family transposase, partial [Pseudonocardiaceae bacterium]|nr:IS66 family transposase [Pseudonocardiaceae bacterium]